MRPRLVKVGRRIELLNAPVIALLIWVLLLIAVVAISRLTGTQPMLCSFRALTGVPCPSCGSTRGVLLLTEGDVIGAFLMNPLVMITLAVLATIFTLRLLFAVQVKWNLGRRERWVYLGLVIAAILANWWWVIEWDERL